MRGRPVSCSVRGKGRGHYSGGPARPPGSPQGVPPSPQPFRPPPFLVGGHRQTLLGFWSRRYLRWPLPAEDLVLEAGVGPRPPRRPPRRRGAPAVRPARAPPPRLG